MQIWLFDSSCLPTQAISYERYLRLADHNTDNKQCVGNDYNLLLQPNGWALSGSFASG